MRMIFLMIMISSFAYAQEECDREGLARQCYTNLCSSRKNIPDTIEGLAADLRESPVQLPPEAVSNIQKQARDIADYMKQLTPVSESEYLAEADRYVETPELAENDLMNMSHVLNGTDNNGNQIHNDMLSPEETERYATHQNVISGLFENTSLSSLEDNLRVNPTMELSEFDIKALDNLATFARTSDPAKAQALDEIQSALKKKSPVPEGAWSRAGIPALMTAYSKDYLRKHRTEVAAIIRDFEKVVVERSRTRLAQASTNCQLVQYLGQKMAVANNPERLQQLGSKVIQSLNTNFYPKLSEESAQTLRLYVRPAMFTLGIEKPDFSFFKPFEPAQTRTGKALALDELSGRKCTIRSLSRDIADDHVEVTVGGNKPIILISPLTLAQNGEAVLAHELGHAMTELMGSRSMSAHSSEKFRNLRACLNSMHPTETRANSVSVNPIDGDNFHTDEDFGDWMAATLGYETDYLSCDLPRLFEMGGKATVPGLAPAQNDPHSTDLFRLLHTRILRGKSLPQVCTDLINQSPENTPKKCEL